MRLHYEFEYVSRVSNGIIGARNTGTEIPRQSIIRLDYPALCQRKI